MKMGTRAKSAIEVAAVAWGDGGASALVCPLTVHRSTPASVGHDLLTVLGRDVLRPTRPKDVLPVATAWLVAEGIDTVVFEFGGLLDPSLWTTVISELRGADIACWLTLDSAVSPDHRRAWDAAGAVALSSPRLASALETRWQPALPDSILAEAPFPLVADTEFPTFLADARRHLAPDEFARVQAEYEVGASRMREFWAVQGRGVDHDALYTELRELALDQPAPVAVCRLRGAGSACFFEGDHLLHVNLDVFFANAGVLVSPFDADSLERLRHVTCPQSAAIGALCTALRATLRDLRDLCVGDIHDSGAVVLGGKTHQLPTAAMILVRALIYQRQREGAADDAPLFVNGGGGRMARFDSRARNLAESVGIRVALSASGRENSGTRNETASTWARRTGMALKPLNVEGHHA